ncbi:MAG: glycoside hydrolase family 97 N-terminal domain-containing protein [Muribaculaceae bacterium]|nr:glycoside hydrolase family 97 N-terminal domain-containing protein [Muribaculaceae bacterium]
MKKTILFIATILLSQLALAQTSKTIASPNEKVKFTVFTNPWGIPGYYVIAEGDTLISDSQLGLRYSGSESTGHRIDKVNYHWMQTDTLKNSYNEMVVTITQPYKGTLKIYARAYDNAIAIKQGYVVDDAEKVFLQDDNTCITFVEEAKVNETPVDSLSEISLPVDFKLRSGKVLSVSSGKQEGYPQISLNPVKTISNMVKVNLKPMYDGNDNIKSVQPASFESPYIYIKIKE